MCYVKYICIAVMMSYNFQFLKKCTKDFCDNELLAWIAIGMIFYANVSTVACPNGDGDWNIKDTFVVVKWNLKCIKLYTILVDKCYCISHIYFNKTLSFSFFCRKKYVPTGTGGKYYFEDFEIWII